MTASHGAQGQIDSGDRFAFGDNWRRFLAVLDERRIETATRSLAEMLGTTNLQGKRFLDAGSGSGLFSLAAVRLGAEVVSFDFDQTSVACTSEVRRRFGGDAAWDVLHGDVLDLEFVRTLGGFDVVYSWGVLHHTGRMWDGCEAVAERVADGGVLYIALYNDQGFRSAVWDAIKRRYNAAGPLGKTVTERSVGTYFGAGRFVKRVLGPGTRAGADALDRGMDIRLDLRDWVGGYPFEVAAPDVVFDFFAARGFMLRRLRTVAGRLGCNEFVFARPKPIE
jgi:2-polyprenyl-3-methyl-5-hydroxy-6-metoxy-1,4-benzoquinol methylase